MQNGNQCQFGLMLQVGTELDKGLMHSRATVAANAEDVIVAPALLRGAEPVLFRAAECLGLDHRSARRHQLAGRR